MINIAVLGFGVVGSGVVQILRESNKSIIEKVGDNINLKYILDIRNFSNHPESKIIIQNFETIFNDPEINIIVETIGGVTSAYEFTKRALISGRHVITSNKDLVATHGPELLRIAKENNVNYLFEASVGGGIPIIKPLYECLEVNEITSIIGILNGTTNYIITSMATEKKDFQTALKDAQQKGYAEANPTNDVEGYDSCRKIAILSSIAYNQFVNYKNIHVEGITKISYDDLNIADKINFKIKLLAYSKKINDKIFARVCPVLINKTHLLANVEGVFNAILLEGNNMGSVMFYGKGAGKLPTASAIIGDIIDTAKHMKSGNKRLWIKNTEKGLLNPGNVEAKYFVRLEVNDKKEAKKVITEKFNNIKYIKISDYQNQLMFKTQADTDKNIMNKLEVLKKEASIKNILTSIKIFEQ